MSQTTELMYTHPQMVADPQPGYSGPLSDDDGVVKVDVDIHSLMQAVWDNGLRTQACCQGGWPGSEMSKHHGTQGYILFATYQEACRFFCRTYDLAAVRMMSSPRLEIHTSPAIRWVGDNRLAVVNNGTPRAGVYFESVDLTALEGLWTH